MICFDVLTIFPEIFSCYLKFGVVGKAIQKKLTEVKVYNLRDFTLSKHKKIDDYPYGGGSGMVMQIEPIYNAIVEIKKDQIKRRVILLSPQGKLFNQEIAKKMSESKERFLLICGRYEGVDERVKNFIDEELSVGDYILSGGELASLIIIDSIVRLIPGALGDELSAIEESFMNGLLDYPHYTRPEEFMGMKVPQVLLSGNHAEINRWRIKQSLMVTLKRRPELLKNLSPEKIEIFKELCSEINKKTLEETDEPVNN